MKRLSATLASLFFFLSLFSQSSYPKREVRAVWLTTIGGLDWPHSYAQSSTSAERQKQELRQLLDRYRRANINTVLLQTRIRATVIYPSQIEPWDGCLSGLPGKSPGYDALQFAINECHKRGMELHAWIVTIPIGKWDAYGCRQLRRHRYKMLRRAGAEGFMNPELPETADYLADLCAEVTRNYDVDGIHLDYIRYPETWPAKVNKAQGRAHITHIVRAVHERVKALKPWVKLSCAPIGKRDDLTRFWSHGWNAYTTVCQDVQGWMREGWMDEVFPMMYFKDEQFYPFAIDWAESAAGKIVAPGLGIYFLHPKEKNWAPDVITREMAVLRQNGLGHAFFRGKFLTDNVKGIYDFTADRFDLYPALVPSMPWLYARRPAAPTWFQTVESAGGITLRWSGATDHSGAPYLLYNVYASSVYPVDVADARNLIAPRLTTPYLQIPSAANRYFAVTAMDRYGNESEPLQMSEKRLSPTLTFLPTDGRTLRLPDDVKLVDAEYVVIESMTGTIVATRPIQAGIIHVSMLKNGVYTVRTLDRKHVTHRLGMLILKR